MNNTGKQERLKTSRNRDDWSPLEIRPEQKRIPASRIGEEPACLLFKAAAGGVEGVRVAGLF